MKALEITNLSFAYDKDLILENINLVVEKKDFLAIIGPNGGGKSTLLKLILGLEKQKHGTIKVLNKNSDDVLSSIGYVPQNTNININFPITVLEVVMMGHSTKRNFFKFGYSAHEKSCALASLEKIGMKEFANYKIGSLSGGQRQRVMISRALCFANSQILLLDEPTANIDIDGQKKIYKLLEELNKEITIIVVSHDISVILGYASKVAHINKKLVFHDISKQNTIKKDGHFCEVEMLKMMGTK